MNFLMIFRVLGFLSMGLGITMFLPLGLDLWDNHGTLSVFIPSIAICWIIGALCIAAFNRADTDLSRKDGFFLVGTAWIAASLLGSIPFLLDGNFANIHGGNFINSLFESVAGFTTTGSSVLAQPEALSRALLLWRSMIQWLGGMGIIIFSIAILPILGVGGMQLFKAEMPGPTKDKLTPRIAATARRLWVVYILLTALEFALLWWGPMDWWEALCHAFTTMATGGFSTLSSSVGGFHSAYIEWVITIFMIMAGINFSLHYIFIFKNSPSVYVKNVECRNYLLLTLGLSGLIGIMLFLSGPFANWSDSFRTAIFQVASIMTTTGFATVDYQTWIFPAQGIIFALMMIGGCAGSTSGGIKLIRWMLSFQHASNQTQKLLHPKAIFREWVDHHVVSRDVKDSVLAFVMIYMMTLMVSTLILTATGVDILTSLTACMSAVGNIGPGFGQLGPSDVYASLSSIAKMTLCMCMLLGRLEFFTLLLLFMPSFWRH